MINTLREITQNQKLLLYFKVSIYPNFKESDIISNYIVTWDRHI